ncbi:MAG: isocitrate lyase/phosphoenolpyruvate mutase family protein [Chthoniobacterales bacterium]|nr:isocitrate lyase/phosphoenolpyruvate mutase family protein [Chthoniobacterales bacterium]
MENKAAHFRSLHQTGSPLVLFNVWDAGSTRVVAKAGAAAIATGSWSVAAAQGFDDGEKISRDVVIDVLRRIVGSTNLPVTVDIESGFGGDPEAVAHTVRLSIEAGAIGCNIEDSRPSDGSLRSVEEAAARIQAARRAGDEACPGFFINARSDLFFQRPADEHDTSLVSEVIARARAYADAGADGLFAPGLAELTLIRELAAASPLPLNIMRFGAAPSIAELAAARVARISHGPHPYMLAMEALEQAARHVS